MTNSSSTRPEVDQLGMHPRAPLAQQSADAALGSQMRQRGREVDVALVADDPHRRPGLGRLGLGCGEDQHPPASIGEQGRIPRNVESAADDDHERVVREPVALAPGTLRGIGHDPAVALGSQRAGADHHRVDLGPEADQHLGVGVTADRAGATVNRRPAVERDREVGDHVGTVIMQLGRPARARRAARRRGRARIGKQAAHGLGLWLALVRLRSRTGGPRWPDRRRRGWARPRTRRRGSRRARPRRWPAG